MLKIRNIGVEIQVERGGHYTAVRVGGTVSGMDVRITRVEGIKLSELTDDEREWARGELLLAAKRDESRLAERMPAFIRRCA